MSRMVPDDFEFQRTLGIGAFSKVLVARYHPDTKKYAVKIIPKRQILSAPSEEERTRMAEVARREMKMLLICDHPNIVKFHASMQTPDDLMYVTELCSGGELLDVVKRRGSVPLPAARHVMAEIVSVLHYLHHAPKRSVPIVPNATLKPVTILHRDIKPENIMLSERKHVKLIDFGTAVLCDSADAHPHDERMGAPNGSGGGGAANGGTVSEGGGAVTKPGRGRAQTFCGTTHYMSPELLGDTYTCTASDYWAAGCVLFHMLTGKRPFDAPTQYLLIKAILEDEVNFPTTMDHEAKDLISKLLVKDPAKRFGSTAAGGFEEIKSHSFFKNISKWDSLHEVDVSKLWLRDATWVKDSNVTHCIQCGKEFGMLRRKHHCRNCGQIFCHDCSGRNCIIPESTYTTQERVCDGCFGRLHQH